MPVRLQVVCHEQLEHEQQQMRGQADEHGFVLDVFVHVHAALGAAPPNARTNDGTRNWKEGFVISCMEKDALWCHCCQPMLERCFLALTINWQCNATNEKAGQSYVPATAFQTHRGRKMLHHDHDKAPSNFKANSTENDKRQLNTRNLGALKSWKRLRKLTSPPG